MKNKNEGNVLSRKQRVHGMRMASMRSSGVMTHHVMRPENNIRLLNEYQLLDAKISTIKETSHHGLMKGGCLHRQPIIKNA